MIAATKPYSSGMPAIGSSRLSPAPAHSEHHGGERRAWARYPTHLETFCRQAIGGPEMCWSGIIQNISRGGIQLIMHRRFEPGALLKVDVPLPVEQPAPYLISRVIYATLQPNGTWALGCAFTEELDEDYMWTILKTPANRSEMTT
jgi:PilZ domain